MEHAPQHIPSPAEALHTSEEPAARNQIQIALALVASRESHPGADEKELRSLAMKEWIGDPNDPNSLATRFSEYFDAHSNESVDINNPAMLQKLLQDIRNSRNSLH